MNSALPVSKTLALPELVGNLVNRATKSWINHPFSHIKEQYLCFPFEQRNPVSSMVPMEVYYPAEKAELVSKSEFVGKLISTVSCVL